MKTALMLAASSAALAGGFDFSTEIEFKEAPDLEKLLEGHTKTVEEAVDGVKQQLADVDERILSIEQKAARGGGGGFGPSDTKSWGCQVADADEVKQFRDARHASTIKISLKTITSSPTSGGPVTSAPYRDAETPLPRRQLTVRDLLNVVPVTTGSVEYPAQTTRTNNAATVDEGGLKPTSELAWEMRTVPIRTIAHWVLASRQVLDDAPQLQSLIDGELRYGLELIEEGQILTGAGTGTDLNGIYTQAAAFAAPFDPTATVNEIDIIGLALLQADNADYPADGIVLHPTDWTKMRLLKNADGEYILGDPQAPIDPVLFGRRVVATKAMTAGTFMVGAFKMGATLYDRMAPEVLLSTEDSDNFRKNLVTVLAEERVGLAVKHPGAFFKGDFATILAALNAA